MGGKLSQPNLSKKVEVGECSEFQYACVSMQGWELQMENTSLCCVNIDGKNKNGNSLFAIFDGIRGFQVSYFVKQILLSVFINSEDYIQGNYEQAIRYTFQKIDQLIRSEKGQKRLKQIRKQNNGDTSIGDEIISDATGCMVSLVLLTKKKIYSANIGDSKIYLRKDKNCQNLFQSQRPEAFDEKIRIEKANGQIIEGKINGNVNISRAFGFFTFKQNQYLSWDQQMITCLPQIKILDRNISDKFMFMGCDGIWAAYSKKQSVLVKEINESLQNGEQIKDCLQKILNMTIAEIPNGLNNVGTQNMTGILIKFNQI